MSMIKTAVRLKVTWTDKDGTHRITEMLSASDAQSTVWALTNDGKVRRGSLDVQVFLVDLPDK